jgi:hypothetical protein
MLTQLGGQDEENVRFTFKPPSEIAKAKEEEQKETKGYEGIDWESMVSDQDTSDIPHISTAARALVLLLVRVQV